jgi:lysyl-tRNA synthetase class 1
MRWAALGIDYEMAGKDLIDSVKLSGKICAALGGTPPEGFNYELFLDDKGGKISKSKGNGLTIDEWLRYARRNQPVAVHVSRAEGGQAAVLRRHSAQCRRVPAVRRRLCEAGSSKQRLSNPAWHIHAGARRWRICRSRSSSC